MGGLDLDSRADVGEENLVGEFCVQLGRTDLPGTVRNAQTIKIQFCKIVYRCRKLLVTGRAKVRTADNRMNPVVIKVSAGTIQQY